MGTSGICVWTMSVPSLHKQPHREPNCLYWQDCSQTTLQYTGRPSHTWTRSTYCKTFYHPDQIQLMQNRLPPGMASVTARLSPTWSRSINSRPSPTWTRSTYCKTFSHLDQIHLLLDIFPPGLAPVTARPSPTWTRSTYCKTFSHLD